MDHLFLQADESEFVWIGVVIGLRGDFFLVDDGSEWWIGSLITTDDG